MNNIPEIIDKFKIPLALSVVGIVLIVGGIVSSNINLVKTQQPKAEFPQQSLVTQKKISVDVSGAVINPGVYDLGSDSRVAEAIAAAGGLATNANKDYISKYLNMAQKLSDGMKIYLPFEGDIGPTSGVAQGGVVAGATTAQININSASQSELETLPGIGPVTAAKIIGSRPYQKLEGLLDQKIVSKSVFEKIKALIVIF